MRLTLFVSLIFIFLFPIPNSAHGQYRVTHIGKSLNTTGSETGALRVGDTVLVYSSMQGDSRRNSQFNMGGGVMQVFQARIARNGSIAHPKADRWGLNNRHYHTGNIALDPISKDLYFTRGDLETLDCEIFFARKKKRRGWEKPVKLKGPVNLKGYTSTHPAVGRLADSTVILYFVSNRPGGLGGTDLWYTLVKDGRSSECVNLGPMVNSTADEYTPFFDQRNGVLYFSSDREGGKGGHDIYCATGHRNTWQKAEPVCHCLNSEQNDLYFTISDYDSATGMPIAGYLASNRADSYFLNDSMCCNDLYQWQLETSAGETVKDSSDNVVADTIPTLHSPLSTLHSFMFPLFLYFHNDEPDPASREATTATTYPECQRRYAALRHEYISRQTNAEDSAMMVLFFDTCVVGNYNHAEELFDYVEALLDDGRHVTLTVAGYASPVFHSDYNQSLSERRIVSFINMVRTWRGGLFEDALDTHRLSIDLKPHGAVEPTTESRSKDPVYGLPAALARRIEILGCQVK